MPQPVRPTVSHVLSVANLQNPCNLPTQLHVSWLPLDVLAAHMQWHAYLVPCHLPLIEASEVVQCTLKHFNQATRLKVPFKHENRTSQAQPLRRKGCKESDEPYKARQQWLMGQQPANKWGRLCPNWLACSIIKRLSSPDVQQRDVLAPAWHP